VRKKLEATISYIQLGSTSEGGNRLPFGVLNKGDGMEEMKKDNVNQAIYPTGRKNREKITGKRGVSFDFPEE